MKLRFHPNRTRVCEYRRRQAAIRHDPVDRKASFNPCATRMIRACLVSLGMIAGGLLACAQQTPPRGLPSSVRYALLLRSSPRPLRIHVVSIDLRDRDLSFDVVAEPDPDGPGRADTSLAPPSVLAARGDALVAINTAAWAMLPDPATGKSPGYVAGYAADIEGWVADGRRRLSAPQRSFCSVWMGRDGKVGFGEIANDAAVAGLGTPVRWAVSGFGMVLDDGRVLREASDVRHPRSAIGLSADGNTLVWMVVDGRQRGFSEGVSEHELGQLLLEAGCVRGLNLDGGGSSSLWFRGKNGRPTLVNSPSDLTGPRAVPVMLVLKHRAPSGSPAGNKP